MHAQVEDSKRIKNEQEESCFIWLAVLHSYLWYATSGFLSALIRISKVTSCCKSDRRQELSLSVSLSQGALSSHMSVICHCKTHNAGVFAAGHLSDADISLCRRNDAVHILNSGFHFQHRRKGMYLFPLHKILKHLKPEKCKLYFFCLILLPTWW